VRRYLSTCDIGVEPAPANPLNVHSTFIKVMEYMAAAKPVVAFDLEETRYSLAVVGSLCGRATLLDLLKPSGIC